MFHQRATETSGTLRITGSRPSKHDVDRIAGRQALLSNVTRIFFPGGVRKFMPGRLLRFRVHHRSTASQWPLHRTGHVILIPALRNVCRSAALERKINAVSACRPTSAHKAMHSSARDSRRHGHLRIRRMSAGKSKRTRAFRVTFRKKSL